MENQIVGTALIAGMTVFLVGAAGWRQAYELPHEQSLVVIHGDKARRAWIHIWMLIAMVITPAAMAGLAATFTGMARLGAVMAAVIYTVGAVCWVASLAFRLTVVPWAAQRTVADGEIPAGFVALDHWAGVLYVVHMASAYVAFMVLGFGVLNTTVFAAWAGWVGVIAGGGLLVGFVATRFAGPFNPPFLAHSYTGLVGVLLLRG